MGNSTNIKIKFSKQELLQQIVKIDIFIIAFYQQNAETNLWKINLLLSAHNLNLKNLWTGEWLSHWSLEKANDNSYKLTGNVKINTYYYEEGNIQFNMDKEFDTVLYNKQEDADLANDVIDFIQKSENAIQLNLDTLFDNLSDQYIKPLRRKLPSNFLFFLNFKIKIILFYILFYL